MANFRIKQSVRWQLAEVIFGFKDLIPFEFISSFNESELQEIICSVADINVQDWRDHTSYSGYTQNDPVIRWFWECVESFDQEQRGKLLQFVTGSPRLPLDGFRGPTRRLTIRKGHDASHLPTSNTWYVLSS